jgi:tRNA threonylcarbamoyladenosine biosynthesis protein TsaB
VRILAVDTTTQRGSVAVVEQGELLGELRLLSGKDHSERLLPAIDFLLRGLGGGPAGIGGYAVALGPGSFTGIRIGISTIQGLALGEPRPCLGVSALDVLAARARGIAPAVVAMMDAWRDEVYAAVYDAEARLVAGPFVEAPERVLLRAPAGAAYIGAGALRYRDEILAHDRDACIPERSLYLAGTLGRLAEPRLSAGEGVPPHALRALYVRAPDAVKPTA